MNLTVIQTTLSVGAVNESNQIDDVASDEDAYLLDTLF